MSSNVPPGGPRKRTLSEQNGSVTVYEELERVKRKCETLRGQLRTMHAAFDKGQIAALRGERDAYRKALSGIAHRIDEDSTDLSQVRLTIRIALETWSMPRGLRRAVVRKMKREEASS